MRKKIALFLATLFLLPTLALVGGASPAAAAEVIRTGSGACVNLQHPNYRYWVVDKYAYSTNGVNVRPYGQTITQQRKINGVWTDATWWSGGEGVDGSGYFLAGIWPTLTDYQNLGWTPGATLWQDTIGGWDKNTLQFSRVYQSNLYNTQRYEKMWALSNFANTISPDCGLTDGSVPF